jgi:apolipoprotein N-acyltransferase
VATDITAGLTAGLILKNAVENHFTAKPQRAQRTYSKIKLRPFGEAIDHLDFDSDLCFS